MSASVGHGGSSYQAPAWRPPVCHTSFKSGSGEEAKLSFLEQAFPSESVGQKREGDVAKCSVVFLLLLFFESFFLNNQLKFIILKGKFRVAKLGRPSLSRHKTS